MFRSASILFLVAALAAWADAQNAAPRYDEAQLLHANAAVLEDLVARAVRVSNAPTNVARADECRQAVASLGQAVQTAADEPSADPARVADLADRLTELVNVGLTPSLEAVRAQVRTGSLSRDKLTAVEDAVKRDLLDCQRAVPDNGRVGAAPAVRAARAKLAAAAEALGKDESSRP